MSFSLPLWECVGVWKSVSGLSLQEGVLLSVLLLLGVFSCVLDKEEFGMSLNICTNKTISIKYKLRNSTVHKYANGALANLNFIPVIKKQTIIHRPFLLLRTGTNSFVSRSIILNISSWIFLFCSRASTIAITEHGNKAACSCV